MEIILKAVRQLSRLYSVKSEDSKGCNTPLTLTNLFVFVIACYYLAWEFLSIYSQSLYVFNNNNIFYLNKVGLKANIAHGTVLKC